MWCVFCGASTKVSRGILTVYRMAAPLAQLISVPPRAHACGTKPPNA